MKQEHKSYALLEPPPSYAASGAFAISIWAKTRYEPDLNGTGYAYLFSHTTKGTKPSATGPDQAM